MADDSMDADGLDADIVQGGGGYVDDDIDIDDDDDDEPLVSAATRADLAASPMRANKRRDRADSSASLPDTKRRKKEAPHPDDFLLRAAGTGDLRDYIVAKFVTRAPDLEGDPQVRLYRDTEPTVQTRKEGIEADRKQKIYFKSFSGRSRLERYSKQGLVSIPDRYLHGWTMEVTPKHVLEERERKEEAAKHSSTAGVGGANTNASPNPNEKDGGGNENQELEQDVDVFAGTFDGKATSSYAIMVLSEGSKTVDVVPIDDYAWFSFRANRAQGGPAGESVEALMAKAMRKGQERISKFQNKYEEAQNVREQNLGDNSRIKASKEFASFGIQRSRNSRNVNDEGVKEEFDFEQEFDNDDVATVDKETIAKTENRVLDVEQNARNFRKLIKDEPITPRPASPGSESEEDPAQGKSSNPPSRSPSPSRAVSPSRSRSRSSQPTPPGASRHGPSRGTTPSLATPMAASPSPTRSPKGNTPQRPDLSHLLPPPGTLPTRQHVISVLNVLLRDCQRIPLKEVLRYFNYKTKEQKSNLIGILRDVAHVVKDPEKPKTFFISRRRPGLPTG